jgi:CubicO group peptidase (beta-lactamase class C family)
MKNLLMLLNGLFLLSCSNGQTQIAETGLKSTQIQTSEEQTELIYEKTKSFPENTQLSIAIIDKGKVKFIGIKRVNDSIIQIENHRSAFEIGSISKIFTSTLLANFVVNNRLKLENNIQDFVDFDLKTNESITFKQLANHTSGLPRLPSNLNLMLADPSNPYKDYDEEKLKSYLKEKIKLNQAPGTKYEYSNLGAGLLGYLLKEISTTNYNKLLEEIVFSKYGMSSSSADRSKLKSELVKGLDSNGKETANWDFNVLVGAGGILSTVEDLTKFSLAQFEQENAELQLTHQPTFKLSETMEIGLGWLIIKASDGNNEVIWHNGGTGGYTSSMALDLNNKNGIIILSNVSAFNKDMGEIDNLCFGLIKAMWKEN